MRRKKWTRKSINSLDGRSHPGCTSQSGALPVHAISITRHGRPGGHVRDRAARSRSGHRRFLVRLAVGGVSSAGIAARTTPRPAGEGPP
jgi:hypothetical protein